MKTNATFYHAGCPVCIEAEEMILETIDRERFDVEIVHLGEEPGKIGEAEQKGVKSVPALTVANNAFHINFGASLADLKN